ncbi:MULTISPECIES: FtsQ-type POTRA domain-containing protein [unclassified Cryobacterium]|uniref:FtsQ-type POTRA domain-containing protein n=1 Tax=unclassified Cryobacterium TaxID=2649013 RepID=UPI002AB43181|nr:MULTISPECIES: FtsQ-type POTRA domain-containing protein [unclassified Cryobacterium]MDY7543640.1 FtsQ-type POTRA domain-containing protein [Cryobacterium sp. 5B3]MEA9998673.1 FtsQ-type POTRA domain-containing protein [Cryobacterium sp. RTS3]MEB0264400.1 FtsQ-type POTRA domain-containing protein [Cryobacterium sp. 10I5]MEB0276071.1 FtsQ-type POTRA domain-containing protein [Cryobacterium sp. 5B3]
MRRPEGFDRPEQPPTRGGTPPGAAATPGGRGTKRSSRRPADSAPPSAATARSRGTTDGTRTEPITLPKHEPEQPHLASVSPLHTPGAQPADPVTEPIATVPAKTPGVRVPKARASDAEPVIAGQAGERAEPALTPATARRRFRAARRARKRYEREEVRRFTWRSRRRRTVWFTVLGTVAALVGFVLVGAYSPLMALRTVEVVGTSRISADQVQAALGDQLGTPLPLVDFARIRADLGTFPLIQSYVTESRPPDTLVVRIVERTPVGTVVVPGGFNLVDAAGVVIQGGTARVVGYPVIDARAGVGSAGFQAATAVIAAVPAAVRQQLDTVTAATTDDVTLVLTGGARVVWGSAERSEYKAVVLAALIVSHPVGTVKEYDVSSPDSAVLR